MFASALVLILLAGTVESWLWSSSSSSSRDLTDPSNLSGQRLTDLYNSPVATAEWMARPMGSSSSSSLGSSGSSGSSGSPLSPSGVHPLDASRHSGVRLTLEDGSQWLVHKGSGYGRSSQTVVTDAKHMSSAWEAVPENTRDFDGTKTVSDFVKTGGSTYNLLRDNCHQAARKMMEQK